MGVLDLGCDADDAKCIGAARRATRLPGEARIEFEVTHPFHPWRGQRFVLSTRKQNWGEDRVMFYDAQGRLRSLPASWTDCVFR